MDYKFTPKKAVFLHLLKKLESLLAASFNNLLNSLKNDFWVSLKLLSLPVIKILNEMSKEKNNQPQVEAPNKKESVSVLEKIRRRTGLLVGIVGLALVIFILEKENKSYFFLFKALI